MPKYAGIDPSLTSSGVVTYDTETGARTVASFSSSPDKGTIASRLQRVQTLALKVVDAACAGGVPDRVAIEGPAFSSSMGKSWDRAALWWFVVQTAISRGCEVIEIPPPSLKRYGTGKGNAGKDEVLLAVSRTYPDFDIKNNDESDAVVLCALVARLSGNPFDGDLPKIKLDALTKLK